MHIKLNNIHYYSYGHFQKVYESEANNTASHKNENEKDQFGQRLYSFVVLFKHHTTQC